MIDSVSPLEEGSAGKVGSVHVGGEEIAYEARAESAIVRDDTGAPLCSIFSVSYTRAGVDTARRPVLYAFDGGPGTASMTLLLGLLGPRRLDLDPTALDRSAPATLVDNPRTLLDVADLVVLDPVNTGFSRTAPDQDPRRFCGYTEDMESVARFIVDHLARTGRGSSPLLLLGESYGGMRAAGLVLHLQERYGIYPSGVGLLVPALSAQALSFTPGNDLPYVLYLPTMAAIAHHHQRAGAGRPIDAWLGEAEAFAVDEYAPALLRGAGLQPVRQRAVVRRLAELTGVDESFIDRANLRISDQRFFKELLRDRRLILSRADPRVTGVDADAAGETPEHDPYTAFIRRAFTTAVGVHVRDELGYRTRLDFRGYDARVLPWRWADVAENRFFFGADLLRLAMAKHPGIRVFIASGVYDGSVPYFGVENTIDRAVQEPALAPRVVRRRYPTGHLLYIEEAAATRLRCDLADFIAQTSPAGLAPER